MAALAADSVPIVRVTGILVESKGARLDLFAETDRSIPQTILPRPVNHGAHAYHCLIDVREVSGRLLVEKCILAFSLFRSCTNAVERMPVELLHFAPLYVIGEHCRWAGFVVSPLMTIISPSRRVPPFDRFRAPQYHCTYILTERLQIHSFGPRFGFEPERHSSALFSSCRSLFYSPIRVRESTSHGFSPALRSRPPKSRTPSILAFRS